MKNIRTAVVGLSMGLSHAYAFHAAKGSELTYVVDLDEEKAKKVANELGCKYTTDWTKILDEIDAVSLCTPHHLHAPQSMIAIAAGKHVLLEKPLANSEEECLRIIEASEANGTVLMLAYIVRFYPAILKLKELLDSGVHGKPINADCWIQGYLPPMPGSWFSRKDQLGGGVLFSHGCHYIDLLLWLFGKPVEVGMVGTQLGTEWMEGEGTAHSIMRFESGTVAHLETSWGMKFQARPALLHIHTTEALLIVDGGMSRIDVIDKDGERTVFGPIPAKKESEGTNIIYEVEHFIACIQEGKRPITDGMDSLRSLRTIWSMYDAQLHQAQEIALSRGAEI